MGINLTNEVKDLYTKNYKVLLKEIKEANQWKDIRCTRTGIQSLSKSQCHFLSKILKSILKFTSKFKGPLIGKTVLKIKIKTGGLMLSDFKTYCKATVIRIAWYCHKDSRTAHTTQKLTHVYGQMIFYKGTKTIP